MFDPIQLALAGIAKYILHWGLFGGLAIGLVAASYFAASIPYIGRFLEPIRRDLLWAAFGCVLIMYGMYLGGKDASNRCDAKQMIVEKVVTKAVDKTKTPKAKRQNDRWDRPEY